MVSNAFACPWSVDATLWDNVTQHTTVFNDIQIQDVLHVRLPQAFSWWNDLIKLRELTPTGHIDVDYSDHVIRLYRRPWLTIPKELLNLNVGQHIYQCQFVNPDASNARTDLYFGYIIQLDDPPKPYYYMEKYHEHLETN